MKQFNLKEYLKNPSRKIVTGDGRAVKILCTNYELYQPIIAEIEGHNCSRSFTKDGRYYIEDRNSLYDLFFAPEKYEGWVNVYRIGGLSCGRIFDSEEKARQSADEGAIATAKIEWEE